MQKITDKLISWASEADELTIEQAKQSAGMPFVYPHIALMPDAHLGKGSTVGSVIPTMGVVLPSAVGVDIGCFVGETKIPDAYKPIDQVMADAESLVTIRHTLRQIVNVKGD